MRTEQLTAQEIVDHLEAASDHSAKSRMSQAPTDGRNEIAIWLARMRMCFPKNKKKYRAFLVLK
jgi:hypothetical protein